MKYTINLYESVNKLLYDWSVNGVLVFENFISSFF